MFQDYPVLLSSSRNGDNVTVQGTLTAGAMQSFTIEFFSNQTSDPSGNGQGQTFIGSAIVTTDATGLASFTATFDNVTLGQDVLTATATDALGNTSEFSAAILVTTVSVGPAATATSLSSSDDPSVYGQTVALTAFVTNLSGADIPTGVVNFMDDQTLIGTVQLDASGQAVLTTSAMAVGDHTITAIYAGEGSFLTSTSDPLAQLVNRASTVTSVISSGNPSTYGQAITLSASVSPLAPGDGTFTGLVTFMDGSTVLGTASLSNGQASLASVFLAAGAHNITAVYGGDANFDASTSTVLNQTVTPAVLTVTANAATNIYGTANPTLTSTIAGFVNGDTPAAVTGSASLTTTATAGSSVGSYAITAAQGTLSAANYTFTYAGNSLTVTPAALTVTANAASKIYGAANPTLTSTIAGFVNGDTASAITGAASLTTTATAGSSVGSYAIMAAQGTLSAANYTFTYAGNSLTVTPATLTVTANAASKIYGAANPTLTSTIAGFVNGDTSSAITGAANLTTTATAGSAVGTYVVTAAKGTLTASNYTFACVSNSLTVTPAVLTVTANGATKIYGAANPTLTSAFSGFVNGDTAAVVTGSASLTTTATPGSSVGSYAITAAKGTLSAVNYTFACVGNSLTVTPAATVSAISSSANPSVVGQAVTFTASVRFISPGSGSLTGSVTFKDGTTVLGTAALSNGMASVSTSAMATGGHSVTAVYSGDTNCTASTSTPMTQSVNAASSLAGYAYLDTNNDGVKQTSEAGITGVWITLSGTNDLGAITPVSVQTSSTGTYSFANLRPGTYTISEATPAGYLDGIDTIGTQGGTAGNDVLSNIVLSSGVNGANNNFGELKNAVAGHTWRDMSGNGMTSDDTLLSGVTVQLYQDRNGNGTLDSTDGSAIATTVSNASGAYAFLNLAANQYIVNEVVPSGYVRTIPYFSNYYAANLKTTPGGTNFDFDNYKQCTGTITNVSFKIDGCKTVTDLRGQTQQGDTVTVTFTVSGTTATHVTLVTYNAPLATFDATVASQQTIDQQVGGTYNPGTYSLTVTIPNNYYQIDFVKCVAIDILGPANSNIFYSAQGRLISADNAGTHSDVDDMSANTLFWANLGQTLIKNFNPTADGTSSTALGNWLASTYANLYGANSANNMAGKTNDQVAAFFKQLYGNSARKTDAAVLAAVLNVYATTTSLGGDAAATYGFIVTDTGLGATTFNVGNYGAAFNVANNSTLSVWSLLAATNAKSNSGVLYNGLSSLLSQAFSMYTTINADGGIV
jgi:hypothetical protein